jgi:3-hydroxyisobutyrate dehydrogenase-like beta-hydroxyacid dehydrogenase
MEPIGFNGLGRMGRAMAQNLAAAGFPVRVWNRTPGKAPPGTAEKRSVREVAEECRVVVTMLADDAAVESVARELLESLPKDGVHLGMSTISVALSRKLSQEHAARGQRYVAAPVFGRPEAAQARQLWIVPGGKADDLKPIFEALGQGTFPVAEPEQASLIKLCGNFLIASTIESFGEALALAEKGGVDPQQMMGFFGSTLFNAPVIKGYGGRIAATEFEPAGFAMPLGLKDVTLAMKAGEELRVPLPLAGILRDHFLTALARGRDAWDWAGLASAIREAAGLPATRVASSSERRS